jgi:hypothetical protein
LILLEIESEKLIILCLNVFSSEYAAFGKKRNKNRQINIVINGDILDDLSIIATLAFTPSLFNNEKTLNFRKSGIYGCIETNKITKPIRANNPINQSRGLLKYTT